MTDNTPARPDGPKPINATLKAVLEYGPLVVFLIAYMKLKDSVYTIGGTDYQGFIVVTALFIPVIVLATGIQWWLTKHLSKMQIVTVVMVIVAGGMSVWFNDERFFKMKPTLIYLIMGGLLGIGLLRGKSYLQTLMGEIMPLEPKGWMILTQRFTALFFGFAVLNEILWRSFSTETWVWFKTFGFTGLIVVFMLAQAGILSKYGIDEDDTSDAGPDDA